jgi:hypothetical protein
MHTDLVSLVTMMNYLEQLFGAIGQDLNITQKNKVSIVLVEKVCRLFVQIGRIVGSALRNEILYISP